MDPQLVKDINEYLPTIFNLDIWEKTPQMRTIPVNESIKVEREVRPYEHAKELISGHDKIGLAPCICRQKQKLIGEGCDKPEEMCMLFGDIVEYYQRRGRARFISQEEAYKNSNRLMNSGWFCSQVIQKRLLLCVFAANAVVRYSKTLNATLNQLQ